MSTDPWLEATDEGAGVAGAVGGADLLVFSFDSEAEDCDVFLGFGEVSFTVRAALDEGRGALKVTGRFGLGRLGLTAREDRERSLSLRDRERGGDGERPRFLLRPGELLRA